MNGTNDDTIRVSDFGAVGNGTTDDTKALQDAVEELRNRDGGTLVLDRRTYLHTELPILLEDLSGFIIEGNGATLKADATVPIIPTDEEKGKKHVATSMLFLNCHSFAVRNIICDGSRKERLEIHLPESSAPAGFKKIEDPSTINFEWAKPNIRLNGCTTFAFEDCESNTSVHDGWFIGAIDRSFTTSFSENGKLTRCSSDHCVRAGLFIDNAYDILVLDTTFTNAVGPYRKGKEYERYEDPPNTEEKTYTKYVSESGIHIEADDDPRRTPERSNDAGDMQVNHGAYAYQGTNIPSSKSIQIIRSKFYDNGAYGVKCSSRGFPENIVIAESEFRRCGDGAILVQASGIDDSVSTFVAVAR